MINVELFPHCISKGATKTSIFAGGFHKDVFISICLDFKMSELSILCVILGILSENHSLSGDCKLVS